MRERVAQLLESALEENKSLFLIYLNISEDNQIRVILDGDKGVTVEDCIAVSRAIEHNLDREEYDFSLEVMSAGASEPLAFPRQYKKNIGRTLQVKAKDNVKVEAKLTEVGDEQILLEWKTKEPKPVGKGKITVNKQAKIAFDDILEAKVIIKF